MRKPRIDASGKLRRDNRDYVAEVRAAAAAIAAEGGKVTTKAIAQRCNMWTYHAGQALRFLRSEGELS